MDLSYASKAAQARAQIADALKRLPPAPPPGTPPAKPLGAPSAPVPPQGGAQAPAQPAAPPQGALQPPAPVSPLSVMGMQPQAQPAPPPQAPNLAVPRAYAKGGKVTKSKRSLAVQVKGN
jgi:hypothetical protein